MKKLFFALLCCPFLISSCVTSENFKNGQAYVKETQVEGIDLSIPVPFIEDFYFVKLRLGMVQVKKYKGNGVDYFSNSKYRDINLLTGAGNVDRTLQISNDDK
jgi:hypothetical protein